MREVKLTTPLAEADVRTLEVGTRVLLSGEVVTARDRAHQYLAGKAAPEELPFDLSGGVIYHCGPMVRELPGGTFELVAAGPTTSSRINIYVPDILRKFGVRAVVGKGGMDAHVLAALKELGAVYLSAVGGAAQVLAAAVTEVTCGFKADAFGAPEGMWVLRVTDLPAVVTMDAHGLSLHEEIEAVSRGQLGKLTVVR